jgi:hypothetical protein
MFRYPEQNFSVMCLCNGEIEPGELTAQVTDIFLADQFKQEADGPNETEPGVSNIISVPEKELAGLAGLYVDTITERYIHFMEDGMLRSLGDRLCAFPGQNRSRLLEAHLEFVQQPIVAGVSRKKSPQVIQRLMLLFSERDIISFTEFTGIMQRRVGGSNHRLSIMMGNCSVPWA